jgi:hypothetical protein
MNKSHAGVTLCSGVLTHLYDLAFFPRQLIHLLQQPQGPIEAINYAMLFHTQFFEK